MYINPHKKDALISEYTWDNPKIPWEDVLVEFNGSSKVAGKYVNDEFYKLGVLGGSISGDTTYRIHPDNTKHCGFFVKKFNTVNQVEYALYEVYNSLKQTATNIFKPFIDSKKDAKITT